MKKIFTLLALLMFGFATFTQANTSKASFQQPVTKTGKPDKRYNANKNLKKDGTSDMRYKTSMKAATKKTTPAKATAPKK